MTRFGEKGAIRKPRGSFFRVALVYPNIYRVGMSNLGYQLVYQHLNSLPRIAAERFFLPDDAVRKHRVRPAALSEESGRPLNDFRLIAFSVPFENDYPAVPGMLLAAGIPPLERDRGPWDPIVTAGGIAVSMNPEPLAPFLDLAFIGEIDVESLHEPATFLALLAETISDFHARPLDRRKFQWNFRETPGAYVPSAYTFEFSQKGTILAITPKKGFPHKVQAVKRDSKETSVPVSVLFAPEAEFGESFLVETNRGCGRGCRFCAGGWVHFPVRHAKFSRFRDQVDKAVDAGRIVGLIGSDLAGHPQLEAMLTHIVARGGKFSLSSIRPEGLTPGIIKLIAQTGQKTATLAPEVASSRMKKVIGKEIASERFYELIEQLVAAGIPNLRFYFMLGLPTETDEDVHSVVDFILRSRRIFVESSRSIKKIGKMAMQVNAFVPKPWTPFQWAPMLVVDALERRFRIVRNRLAKEPNLVVRVESPKQAIIQGFLSRADRRAATAILRAAEQEGSWSGVFKKAGIDVAFYTYRERSADEIFPWDVTNHGVAKKKLRTIYEQAMSETSITD